MVEVVLKYNPYKNETKVAFNGAVPRINSMIEKYDGKILQDWLDKLPEIFENEMNGYNFELIFDGTKTDFEDLKEAFKIKGVNINNPQSKPYVEFTHNGVIEECETKIKKIEELHKWLEEYVPCEYEDKVDVYINEYKFEKDFSLIYVSPQKLETSLFEDLEVSVVSVDSLESLKNEEVSNIPIILEINDKGDNRIKLIKDAIESVRDNNIQEKQLFFLFNGTKDTTLITRQMIEEGFSNPQIVESINDTKILRYQKIYSFSDYVRNSINSLRIMYEGIHECAEIDKTNAINSKSNEQVIITARNDEKNRIEGVLNDISTKRYRIEPDVGESDIKELIDNIYAWKKLVKIIKNDKEAFKRANELEKFINTLIAKMQQKYIDYTETQVIQINNYYLEQCRGIKDFNDECLDYVCFNMDRTIHINENLSSIFVKKFTRNNKIEKGKVISEKIYTLKDWKDKAISIILQPSREFIAKSKHGLCEYDSECYKKCYSELKGIIKKYENEIEDRMSYLDDNQKEISNRIIWCEELGQKIQDIEG